MSRVSWDVTVGKMFEDGVSSGLTVVLQSEGKSYSYSIENGNATFAGDGDYHDPKFSAYGRSITLDGPVLSGSSSRQYNLTVYPTDFFFEVYSTSNPMVATVGSILIVLVTSVIFFVYDFVVRREFDAKSQLLEAKRNFMRFVSHEVRTPLNSVCMGLTLLQQEIGEARHDPQVISRGMQESCAETTDKKKKKSVKFRSILSVCSDHSSSTDHCVDVVADAEPYATNGSIDQWLTLVEEIRLSANTATDILTDLLNYDKIESGTLSLELTVFSIWRLVSETCREFRLSAKKNQLNFHIDFTELAGDHIDVGLESFQVVGDRIRLMQVVRNLVSNAIKFTPQGGKFVDGVLCRDFHRVYTPSFVSYTNVTLLSVWLRHSQSSNVVDSHARDLRVSFH